MTIPSGAGTITPSPDHIPLANYHHPWRTSSRQAPSDHSPWSEDLIRADVVDLLTLTTDVQLIILFRQAGGSGATLAHGMGAG